MQCPNESVDNGTMITPDLIEAQVCSGGFIEAAANITGYELILYFFNVELLNWDSFFHGVNSDDKFSQIDL